MFSSWSRVCVCSLLLLGPAAGQAAESVVPGTLERPALRGSSGPEGSARDPGLRGAVAPESEAAIPPSTSAPPSERGDQSGTVTWSIFGFTSGADVGYRGDKTLYSDSYGYLGRGWRDFRGVDTSVGLSYSLTDNLNVYAAASTGAAQSRGNRDFRIDDLDLRGALEGSPFLDRSSSLGLSAAIKYQLLKRDQGRVGLAFEAAPYWQRAEEPGAIRRQTFGAEFTVLADAALVPGELYGAINVSYAPEVSDFSGLESVRNSYLTTALALSARVAPGVFLGSELRYARTYEGAGLGTLLGEALYLGPTIYIAIAKRGYIGAAWSVQVAGHSSDQPWRSRDLTNYERHRLRIKTGIFF